MSWALAALLPGPRWVSVPGPGCPASGPRWAHVPLWPGLCTSHIAAPVLSTRNVKVDDLKTVDLELVGFLKYLIKWFEGRPG